MAFVYHYYGKSFTSAEKVRAHKAVHDETQLQCHICDKVFIGKKKKNILWKYLIWFKTIFEFLYEEFRLPMTLKIHVIIDHYSDYFQWTNQTMRLTNAEFTETAHSTFKMSERIHKFKISRKIGTPVHQEMALKSLVWHNSKRAGFVSPQDFRLRKSSPRVWGSPLSSPRLKLN